MVHLVDDIYTIIEALASVYDIEKISLKEFLNDVRRCHALHSFIVNKLSDKK